MDQDPKILQILERSKGEENLPNTDHGVCCLIIRHTSLVPAQELGARRGKKKLSFIKCIHSRNICKSPGLRFGNTAVNNTDEALVLIKLMLVQWLLARGNLFPRSQPSTACRCSGLSLVKARRGCTLACSGGQGATNTL